MNISRWLVSLLVGSLLLAGCGGSSSSNSLGTVATIQPATTELETQDAAPTATAVVSPKRAITLAEREKFAFAAIDAARQESLKQNPNDAMLYARGPVNLMVTDDVDRSLVNTYTLETLVGFFSEIESIDGHFIPTRTAYVQGIVIIGHLFTDPATQLNDQIQVSIIYQKDMPQPILFTAISLEALRSISGGDNTYAALLLDMAMVYPTCLNAMKSSFSSVDELLAWCYNFSAVVSAGVNHLDDTQTGNFFSKLEKVSFEGKQIIFTDSPVLRAEIAKRAYFRG